MYTHMNLIPVLDTTKKMFLISKYIKNSNKKNKKPHKWDLTYIIVFEPWWYWNVKISMEVDPCIGMVICGNNLSFPLVDDVKLERSGYPSSP